MAEAWEVAGTASRLLSSGGHPPAKAAALSGRVKELAELVRDKAPEEAEALLATAERLKAVASPEGAVAGASAVAERAYALGRRLRAEMERVALRTRLYGVLALVLAVVIALWAFAKRGQMLQALDTIVAATRDGGPSIEEASRLYGREVAGALFAVRQLLDRAKGAEERLRQETVSRYLMSEILRDLSESVPDKEAAMMEAGRRFARRLSGSLSERLETYERQGLGRIRLLEVDGKKPLAMFAGEVLFESLRSAEYPQDHFARGFLAETVEQLVGVRALCEEVACQARGDKECRFVVYPLGEADPERWRKALEG